MVMPAAIMIAMMAVMITVIMVVVVMIAVMAMMLTVVVMLVRFAGLRRAWRIRDIRRAGSFGRIRCGRGRGAWRFRCIGL